MEQIVLYAVSFFVQGKIWLMFLILPQGIKSYK